MPGMSGSRIPALPAYRPGITRVTETPRCLTPPPCGNTLALCDASSMSGADCIVFDAAMRVPYDEPGNQFESQFAMFNPAQRWYCFSGLRPGELIVFKG